MGNDLTIKHVLPVADLYGLVVCGGNSSRMGTDKSMLQYYQKPQRYHVYEMLQHFCEQVFISCNAEQANTIKDGYLFLTDNPLYNNIGPMAALLTALTNFPEKNILFIGCDYPFITANELQQFAAVYNASDNALAFYNDAEDVYEPLLAWYPASSFEKLKEMFKMKQYSLQHFLKENKASKFYPENKISMISIDTNSAFIKALSSIKQGMN